jgi:excinuclease UvrABC ATPase subunit
VSVCLYCDGEGVVHRPDCAAEETEDDLNCNCKKTKCPDCHGRGRHGVVRTEELLTEKKKKTKGK